MARILHCHPKRTEHDFHIFTDLDFWDARRIVGDVATVRRNFGEEPSGDEYPTQVVADGVDARTTRVVERRLRRAIASPPRHVIVRAMVFEGAFEFDPLDYYPERWRPGKMMFFTRKRLPLQQTSLANMYETVELAWTDGRIRLTRVRRDTKHDPIIRTEEEARARFAVPSCF